MPKEPTKEGFLTIKETTVYAGFAHDIYTRSLLSSGKFDEPTPPVKREFYGYSRWEIAKESVDFYLSNRTKRTEGRRFILKIDLKDEERVRTALDSSGVEYELELSYKKGEKKAKKTEKK